MKRAVLASTSFHRSFTGTILIAGPFDEEGHHRVAALTRERGRGCWRTGFEMNWLRKQFAHPRILVSSQQRCRRMFEGNAIPLPRLLFMLSEFLPVAAAR